MWIFKGFKTKHWLIFHFSFLQNFKYNLILGKYLQFLLTTLFQLFRIVSGQTIFVTWYVFCTLDQFYSSFPMIWSFFDYILIYLDLTTVSICTRTGQKKVQSQRDVSNKAGVLQGIVTFLFLCCMFTTATFQSLFNLLMKKSKFHSQIQFGLNKLSSL